MNVLMLGLSDTGKTTFLAQLFGRMRASEGALRLREAPADITTIRDAYARLAEGLSVQHTTSDVTELPLALPAVTPSGEHVEINMPDYAGESLARLVREHHIDDMWRGMLTSSDLWLLFVRLEQFPEVPDLLDKPAGAIIESRQKAAKDDSRTKGSASDLPLDMQLVELMQVLLHERKARPRRRGNLPRLNVLLSCWDELGDTDRNVPPALSSRRIPLLYQFLTVTWPASMLQFLGVSAQGQDLSPNKPDQNYAESTPAANGYLVDPGGERTADLSAAILP